jgi:hypothetical protein
MTTALRDASVSLQRRIQQQLGADPEVLALLPPGAALVVSLNTPDEMLGVPEQGISLWLYKVTRDEFAANQRPRRVSPVRLRAPALPLRLHYLATPVFQLSEGVSAPEFEHTMLGKVLQLFTEEPFLTGADLAGVLTTGNQQLTVRLEQLSIEEITRIWDALEGNYKLSVSYEVTVVPIESRREIMTGPPVGTVANSFGTAAWETAP